LKSEKYVNNNQNQIDNSKAHEDESIKLYKEAQIETTEIIMKSQNLFAQQLIALLQHDHKQN